MALRRCITVLVFLCAAAAAKAQNVNDVSAVPGLLAPGRTQYQRFLAAAPHKAFAIGPHGQFGWSAERDGWFLAELGAIYNCNHFGKVLCRVYAADDSIMLSTYDGNAAASAGLLPNLRGRNLNRAYGGETNDDGVPPRPTIRRGNEPGATPVSIPGARLIFTRYLAEMLISRNPPVLIDVDDDGGLHDTLPRALWLRGAGDDAAAKNADIAALFKTLLAEAVPGKETPVILLCASRRCWAAYNAALRAVADGYVNVYWYRGGIAAWEDADLPIVRAVLLAQLW